MEIVHKIEDLPKTERDCPLEPVVITDCGELPQEEKEGN
jgi:hypothetical protein